MNFLHLQREISQILCTASLCYKKICLSQDFLKEIFLNRFYDSNDFTVSSYSDGKWSGT